MESSSQSENPSSWRSQFFSDGRGLWAFVFLFCFFFFSLTAEFWANDKPHLLRFNGQIYFPTLFYYSPQDLKLSDENSFLLMIDYKQLSLGEGDWALWPILRWSPLESRRDLSTYPSAATKENFLGTDDRGRDVLTRLIYGLRPTLIFSVLSWLLSTFLGLLIGALMAGGSMRVDLLFSRGIEIVESLPRWLILLLMISIFEPRLWVLILSQVLLQWSSVAVLARNQFLTLQKKEFVLSLHVMGEKPWQIYARHLMPHVFVSLLATAPFAVAQNFSSLVVLEFLGLSWNAPAPSWGELLLQGREHLDHPLLILAPSVVLLLTVGAMIRLGESLRRSLSPSASLVSEKSAT